MLESERSVQRVEDAEAFFAEDFADVALVVDAAVAEGDDLGLEEEGLFDVVGDGEDGDAAEKEGFAEPGEDGVAEGAVDAGEGLVEEHELRVGDGEGAGEVDALLFAAGEVSGVAVGEVFEMEELKGGVDVLVRSC
jgi:hypothetical protein